MFIVHLERHCMRFEVSKWTLNYQRSIVNGKCLLCYCRCNSFLWSCNICEIKFNLVTSTTVCCVRDCNTLLCSVMPGWQIRTKRKTDERTKKKKSARNLGTTRLLALSDSLGNPYYLYTRGTIPPLSPAILNTIKWYVRRDKMSNFFTFLVHFTRLRGSIWTQEILSCILAKFEDKMAKLSLKNWPVVSREGSNSSQRVFASTVVLKYLLFVNFSFLKFLLDVIKNLIYNAFTVQL